MFKIVNKIFLGFLVLTFFSCEDYLDRAPNNGLDESVVFNDFNSVNGYLDNCFLCVQDYSKHMNQGLTYGHVGQMSDEIANPYTAGPIVNTLNKGLWFNATGAAEVGWSNANLPGTLGLIIPRSFYGIRVASKLIDQVPSVTRLTDDQKNQILGQAHFFRAWFYFEVIRRVGGMPNIFKVYTANDQISGTRLSYQQSSDLIIDELNKAITLLPNDWPASETGRPVKAAAYALKAMAELYSASPLMRNPIDRIDQYTDYDLPRAILATQYAKQCLEYIDSAVPSKNMMSDHQGVFYHSPNFVSAESLWYLNSVGRDRGIQTGDNDHTADIPVLWQNIAFSNRTGNYGVVQCNPTQNIIDMFETKNGYPITLTGTKWETGDPEWTDSMKLHDPFNNRDPRLRMFILVPGEQFGTIANKPNYVCTWAGGRDIGNAIANLNNRTGYMVKKFQWPECVHPRGSITGNYQPGYGKYYYNCIHIRTTQVWLDYAEAMNEAYGPFSIPAGYKYSAVDAINKVRARAGLAPVLSIFTGSKETFRDRIRNERGVELFLENHRWFDIRRWMIAVNVFNQQSPIKGVKTTATSVNNDFVTVNNNYPKPGNVFSYQKVDVPLELRVFQTKHYWYPMGRDEVNRLPDFKQNPGW